MTGKCVKQVEHDVEEFRKEREDDAELKFMELEDYLDRNGNSVEQMKMLTITGQSYPYRNRRIRICIKFYDEYPKFPLKMFILKGKKDEPFLHANVYKDQGDICHPLLDPKTNSTNIKFTHILKKIHELLYKPNFSNAANLSLAKKYNENRVEYFREIDVNALTLEEGDLEPA